MSENMYTESFFKKKNSKRKDLDFDEAICDRAIKSFLLDLQKFLSKYGLSFELNDDDGFYIDDDLSDASVSKLIKALKSFGKNVIQKYDNYRMIVDYNNCVISWYFDVDDLGNSAEVIFQDNLGSSYTKAQIVQFITKTPSNNTITCGKNYIKSSIFSNTVKLAKEIFGESIKITTGMMSMIIDFPEDYTEDANDLYTEASLNDSDMFQKLNKSSSIITKLKKAIHGGVVLDKDYIEEQYLQIVKTKLSPISDQVIKAFDFGDIRLIYNKTAHVTTAVPFIILQVEGKSRACIFIADFCSMNKEGTMLNIEMKKLYTLMESAYIGLKYFTNPNLFNRSSRLAKTIANIYSEMGLHILNREFALSLDKDAYDTINYMIARFALTKVFPLMSKDVIHAYSVGCCNSPSNLNMEIATDIYDRSEINTAEDLIRCLSKNFPKMAKLTYRYYFERWISSFGMGTCLAIDSFPYLYYTIVNVLLGAFLVNVTGLNEIVKSTSGISQFYAEISRIC